MQSECSSENVREVTEAYQRNMFFYDIRLLFILQTRSDHINAFWVTVFQKSRDFYSRTYLSHASKSNGTALNTCFC